MQAAVLSFWTGVPALIFCAALWAAVGAALAFMGGYQPAQLMLTRRGMRRLHVVQGQVTTGIKAAEDSGDLEQALQYLAESVGAEHVSVGSLHITSGVMSPVNIETPEVRVSLMATDPGVAARFCTWSAAPTMEGPAVDQERETIMTGLLRQAADRLPRLDSTPRQNGHSPRPTPRQDGPACSPTFAQTRPSQGQA